MSSDTVAELLHIDSVREFNEVRAQVDTARAFTLNSMVNQRLQRSGGGAFSLLVSSRLPPPAEL